MKKKNIIIDKLYDITPVEVSCIEPFYNYQWRNVAPMVDGYQIGVNFRGNLINLFSDDDLVEEFGLQPKDAKIICRLYSENKNITHVRYVFKSDMFNSKEKSALKFKDKLCAQMVNPINNKYANNDIVPLEVSEKQLSYLNGKVNGYKVSVGFGGDWPDNPKIVLLDNGYYPWGSEVINFDFNLNMTKVDYLFDIGLFNIGSWRACKFIDKIKMQIAEKEQQPTKQFYTPISVEKPSVRYDGEVFDKLTLPVVFDGDVFVQTNIADVCVPKDAQSKLGIKQLPEPEYKNVNMTKAPVNDIYKVYYHFHGKSFKDTFFEMNKFRAKMLSMMAKDKLK